MNAEVTRGIENKNMKGKTNKEIAGLNPNGNRINRYYLKGENCQSKLKL